MDSACGPQYNNMMSLAIFHSDIVSTVSENYAREILTPVYGEGLDPILRWRKIKPYGIVNGLDYDDFDPAKDPHLAARYNASTLERKALNKEALQRRVGLPVDRERPLIGMVGRLSAQKGIDIVVPAMGHLVEEAQVVTLGKGEEEYEQKITEAMTPYPQAARALVTFDAALAQLIYAGCDIYLMPSRFEPCGLGQLIAMRYGTIPLVRHTGGLVDTVQDCTADLSQGNGFVFQRYSSDDLVEAARRALAAFQYQKEAWRQLMLRAMSADYSWKASARKYEAMYYDALRFKDSAQEERPEETPS
jgi:starch synthase